MRSERVAQRAASTRCCIAVEECSDISWRTQTELRIEQLDGESVNVKLLPASALETRAVRDDGFISRLSGELEWSESIGGAGQIFAAYT